MFGKSTRGCSASPQKLQIFGDPIIIHASRCATYAPTLINACPFLHRMSVLTIRKLNRRHVRLTVCRLDFRMSVLTVRKFGLRQVRLGGCKVCSGVLSALFASLFWIFRKKCNRLSLFPRNICKCQKKSVILQPKCKNIAHNSIFASELRE